MSKNMGWAIAIGAAVYFYNKQRAQAATVAATTGSPDVFSYYDPLSASWSMLGAVGGF